MKVLVTIGSMAEKKFTRLFQAVDELCEEGVLDGAEVTAQVGFDHYHSSYYKCFDMVSDENFKKMIDRSDLVITHAGTGTVTASLKRGKKVIIFPRRAAWDEHYDDHQMELAELFAKKGYALQAGCKEELKYHIQHIDDFHPVPFRSDNKRMNRIVIDSIETQNGKKTGAHSGRTYEDCNSRPHRGKFWKKRILSFSGNRAGKSGGFPRQ